MLSTYASDWGEYVQRLVKLFDEGKLISAVDTGRFSTSGGPFRGIEAVADAVEYLYGRKNVGKIIVELGASSWYAFDGLFVSLKWFKVHDFYFTILI